MKKWFVVYTKPRSEKLVTKRLIDQSVEVFCPLINTVRQWSDRKKKVQLPMFTGYIFVHISEKDLARVREDKGVLNFVYWLGKPAVVKDQEIEAIAKIAEIGKSIQIKNMDLDKGSPVVLPDGPFKGCEGYVDRIDKGKVSIHIHQLGCLVHFNLQ
ncbi:MAG: UpxY family transcription antiterminator [Bacteroidota bacterium]